MSQNLFTFVAKYLSGGGAAPLGVDANGALVVSIAGETTGQTPVGATSGNVANAVATATLPAAVGKTNYLTHFSITGSGATAASVVEATVTGLLTGTQTFAIPVPAGVDLAITPLIVNFPVGLPASAPDTAISVSLAALGAGNTNASVNAVGYKQ